MRFDFDEALFNILNYNNRISVSNYRFRREIDVFDLIDIGCSFSLRWVIFAG